MDDLTVVVLTKDSENEIINLLENVSFAQKILIVDDQSQDRTVEVVKNLNDSKIDVVVHSLNNNFSSQRNFALQKVKTEWVLYVDSDEIVTKELKNEITKKISEDEYDGFFIKRVDVMWEKRLEYGEMGNLFLLRLARVSYGKWQGKVHEEWVIKGKTTSLKYELLHYPHPKTSDFIKEVNFYSSLRAEELYNNGKRNKRFANSSFSICEIIFKFFIKQGYKDGIDG